MDPHTSEPIKHLLDVISVTTVLATLTAWLPPLAALLGVIWWGIRIYYEIRTGERKLKAKREQCEHCSEDKELE